MGIASVDPGGIHVDQCFRQLATTHIVLIVLLLESEILHVKGVYWFCYWFGMEDRFKAVACKRGIAYL